MDCQKCQQRPANVHITQYINGVKHETHLCEECAQSLKIKMDFPQLPIHNLNSLLGFLTQTYQPDKKSSDLSCLVCKTPYRKMAESGYVGCSECYRQFETQLEPILKKVHGTSQHRGKIPRRTGASYLLRREIDELKAALRQAIEREEYEEAARIRDKIKTMEGQIIEKREGAQ